jgi:uncharacterized protein (TIGR03435 family)
MSAGGLVALIFVAALAAQPAKPTFDVSSVKHNASGDGSWSSSGSSNAYNITNATLQAIIRIAYGVRDDQLVGGPSWIQTDRFDVVGKMNADGPSGQWRLMLQSLLEDRFTLIVRHQQREMAVFVLELARRDGRLAPGLQRVDDCQRGRVSRQITAPAGGAAMGGCGSAATIAGMVSQHLQATVIDKTGLTGNFDSQLFFKPDEVTSGASALSSASSDLPSFPAALQEQWGLKLETGRGPVDVLVIDSVQHPTPD